MKTCFKCNRELPLTDFYPHPQMADGHLNKCKECNKRDVKENYRANRGHYVEYEKRRFKTPVRKAHVLEYQRRRRKRSIKDSARTAVSNAVRDGKLVRLPCEVCGDPKSQGHHDDYTRPLDVRWLCFKHHREHHGQQVTEPLVAA